MFCTHKYAINRNHVFLLTLLIFDRICNGNITLKKPTENVCQQVKLVVTYKWNIQFYFYFYFLRCVWVNFVGIVIEWKRNLISNAYFSVTISYCCFSLFTVTLTHTQKWPMMIWWWHICCHFTFKYFHALKNMSYMFNLVGHLFQVYKCSIEILIPYRLHCV